MRLRILYDDKHYYIKQQPKLYAETKQALFKLLRNELDVKNIKIRRNSIFCSTTLRSPPEPIN
jgi:hypothetical protein